MFLFLWIIHSPHSQQILSGKTADGETVALLLQSDAVGSLIYNSSLLERGNQIFYTEGKVMQSPFETSKKFYV